MAERKWYWEGTKPISDTCWQAFKIDAGEFVDVGRPFKVRGSMVGREMDRARSIKGHTPEVIAERVARKKFGRVNGISQVRCRRRRR